jgi:predicted helicase
MTEKLILGYIFAVWQRDLFKNKYKYELKNEAPRIPIYKDFHHFANQGEFVLQNYLTQNKANQKTKKIEFEIVELFEEKAIKNKKSSKIWFEKEGIIFYDKTTFLQLVSDSIELDFDKINQFKINEKSFFEITLNYLKKNKIDLDRGKEILENIIEFSSRF